MTHLHRAGQQVVGTTRRVDGVDESHLYLDLSEPPDKWECPRRISVAVVCAGVTRIETCRLDPIGTARVNVQGVSDIVGELVGRGAFVVYLSSVHVFDGKLPHRNADEPLLPATEHGRQKARAEELVSQWGNSVAIVRMNKVLGPDFPLFSMWKNSLMRGEVIRPFSDMHIAPIPLSCAVSTLRLICDLRLPGVWHVAGSREVSYAEAGCIGAKVIGADRSLIQPVEASKSGHYHEPVHLHTTLNIDRLRSSLGIEPPDVTWTIETAFTNPRVLCGEL